MRWLSAQPGINIATDTQPSAVFTSPIKKKLKKKKKAQLMKPLLPVSNKNSFERVL